MEIARSTPPDLQREVDQIFACDDPKVLMKSLEDCVEVTLRMVIKLAAIVRRLEELGVEISLQLATLPYIRRIAYGQLSAQLFVTLQGDPCLLDRAAALPLPEQEQIARNEPLKVMCMNGDHRLVPPLSLTRREIGQLFARGRIRSDGEQIGWLREQVERQQLDAAVKEDEEPVKLDRKRRGLVVGNHFLSESQLDWYLTELRRRRRR